MIQTMTITTVMLTRMGGAGDFHSDTNGEDRS